MDRPKGAKKNGVILSLRRTTDICLSSFARRQKEHGRSMCHPFNAGANSEVCPISSAGRLATLGFRKLRMTIFDRRAIPLLDQSKRDITHRLKFHLHRRPPLANP
ncbi:MAG: hypothetical protein ABJF10_28650 [Chthoniobacter sp.]